METWQVVGIDGKAAVKFNDGRVVEGVRWFLVGDAPQDKPGRYVGQIVKDQFVSNERVSMLGVKPQPGQIITLYFNRFGDIAKVEVAQ